MGYTSNEALISIINSKTAKISLPKIGVEKVTLTASLSLGDKKDSVERVVTLDSGYRVGTYVATVSPMDDNKTLEVDCTKSDPDGAAFVYEYGNPSYQWYRMPVGSRDASEKILEMTDKACELNVGGETGTYWYFCEVTNTVDGQPGEVSYSNFVRVSFTDNGVVIERV